MSSYLSTLLSNTTSRYTTLRRTLLSSSSEEHDTTIDNEEDSHISRVLRAYYTEKGRPLPPWLPPDPRTPHPPLLSTHSYPTPGASSPRPPNPRGGLSDLWADTPAAPAPVPVGSLRKQGLQRSGAAIPARLAPSQELPNRRPLPSQRVGSYQSQVAGLRQGGGESPPPASVQERLKARLGGVRGGSLGAGEGAGMGEGGYERGGGAYEGRGSAYDERGGAYVASGGGMAGSAPGGGGDGADSGEGAGGQGLDRRRVGLPQGPRPGR